MDMVMLPTNAAELDEVLVTADGASCLEGGALRGEAAGALADLFADDEEHRQARKRARFEEEATLRLKQSQAILGRRPSSSSFDPRACTFQPISPPPTIEAPLSVTPSAAGMLHFAEAELTPPHKELAPPSPPFKGPAPPSLGRSPSIMAAAAALFDAARCGTRRRLQMADTGPGPVALERAVPIVSSASPKQLQQLAAAFLLCPHPTRPEMSRLARHVDLPQPTLELWFERRRELQQWVGQRSPPQQPAEVAKWHHAEASEAARAPQQ